MSFTDYQRMAVAHAARAQVGAGYKFLGEGPNFYDCSGSVLAAWKYGAGITLPHNSVAQSDPARNPYVRKVTNIADHRRLLWPGDLLFFYADISHVAIYIGFDPAVSAAALSTHLMVNATGDVQGVELISVNAYAVPVALGYMGH